MLKEELTYEEITAMNIAGAAKIVARAAEQDALLDIPEEDLKLFFRHTPGTRMLDVGCGWGRLVERFLARGMDYVGIDYCPEMIEEAVRRHPTLAFKVMSFQELDAHFEPATFDALWANCIIDGEPKDRLPAALSQMHRVLKTGGILVLVSPLDLRSEERVTDGPYGRLYFALWTFEELSAVLKDAGFMIVFGARRFKQQSVSFVLKKRV